MGSRTGRLVHADAGELAVPALARQAAAPAPELQAAVAAARRLRRQRGRSSAMRRCYYRSKIGGKTIRSTGAFQWLWAAQSAPCL